MSKSVLIRICVFAATLILLLLVFKLLVRAQVVTIGPKVDSVTYWGDTSETVTVAWEASAGATRYEWEAYHAETQMVILTGNTASTSITFTLPKAGHFILRLRACKPAVEPTDPDLCSEWIDSLDAQYAQVDNQPRSWWVYRVLAPPGDLEFGQ